MNGGWIPPIIFTLGLVAIVTGAWLLWPELGVIVAGVIAVLGAAAYERGRPR